MSLQYMRPLPAQTTDTTAEHARLTRNDVSGIWQPDGGFLQVVVSNRCPHPEQTRQTFRSVGQHTKALQRFRVIWGKANYNRSEDVLRVT